MKSFRAFYGDRTRYDYDDHLLDEGFLQVDTEQDASYYGNWVNLEDQTFVQFAEGDETRIRFDDSTEMASYLRRVYQLLHIDAGLRNRDQHMARAEELGIRDLMA